METYYLEYEIIRNRRGLLGDVTSLLGMLGVNIVTVNGSSGNWRGFLLQGEAEKLNALRVALQHIDQKTEGSRVIGIRGMPRVGKTEASIAACVYANKRWVLVSSTIIRQNIRHCLSPEEMSDQCVFLIDGITSTSRGDRQHLDLVRQLLELPIPKIIEHPDILIRDGEVAKDIFDYVIELKHQLDDHIPVDTIASSISAFDIS
ncbi:MAG: DUF3388 domain-containing protein [Clostridia bacterium]|nr:DUF3388 domain-containing protein [Clostridia bacterium]